MLHIICSCRHQTCFLICIQLGACAKVVSKKLFCLQDIWRHCLYHRREKECAPQVISINIYVHVQLERSLMLFTCVYFHCDAIVVSKLSRVLYIFSSCTCMLIQYSPRFGVQWPGGGWSSHLCHQLSVQTLCCLCLQCLWEDCRNGTRYSSYIVHILTTWACFIVSFIIALRICNYVYHSHIPHFLKISLHLEIPLPSKCHHVSDSSFQ